MFKPGIDTDVLVVDDEGIVVESIHKALKISGISCDFASDIKSALEKLQSKVYRAVVIDIMLPGGDGFEVLKESLRSHPTVPAIIVSGFSTVSNALKSLESGAFDFLPKPFDFGELVGVLQRSLSFNPVLDEGMLNSASLNFLGRHSWALKINEGVCKIGAGFSFQGLMPEVIKVELPPIGSLLERGKVLARIIEDNDSIHTVWSPIDGRVIEVNKLLADRPKSINEDSFVSGWICVVSTTDHKD